MQRSNSQILNRFTMPNGIATNSHEIRTLQKKLLQNHYHPSQPKSTRNTLQTLESSLPQQHLQHYQQQRRQAQKQMRSSLSQDLLNQMKVKQKLAQLDKQSVLSQEHQLLQHMSSLDALEREREKQFNKKYAVEAQEDLKLKQRNREQQMRREREEKEYYKNRYSVGDLTQSYLTKSSTYENPTRNYAQQVDKALKTRDVQYVNPEANSSFKVTRKADSLNNLDFMFRGSNHQATYQQQNSFFNEVKARQCNEKNQLKQALLEQIREKEHARINEKKSNFMNPYTSQQFTMRHHPINNPVDYRFAHDNRYVINELGHYK